MAKAAFFGNEEKKQKTKDENIATVQAGEEKSQIGKTPEQQNVLGVSGKTAITDSPFVNASDEEAKEVHLNHVGQKIDSSIKEADAYLTPDNKTMYVQMEEEGQVFAGEHGRNAHWYPKQVLDTWTKLDKKTAKAEKEEK
jgi:hypothetical protein